jgi:hypothetical protein
MNIGNITSGIIAASTGGIFLFVVFVFGRPESKLPIMTVLGIFGLFLIVIGFIIAFCGDQKEMKQEGKK